MCSTNVQRRRKQTEITDNSEIFECTHIFFLNIKIIILLYHGIIMGPYLYIFLYILLFVVGGLKGIMNPSI